MCAREMRTIMIGELVVKAMKKEKENDRAENDSKFDR